MATVWAAREDAFTWKNDPTKTGWSHAFAFSSLSGLADQMIRVVPALTGAVTKLAIVAHGDERGHVQLDRLLTPESATSFRQDFMQLDAFLGPYARLIFFSCIAGKDEPGSALLNIISGKFLPRRHIIGFEVFGGVGPGGMRMLAGNINAVDRPGQTGAAIARRPRFEQHDPQRVLVVLEVVSRRSDHPPTEESTGRAGVRRAQGLRYQSGERCDPTARRIREVRLLRERWRPTEGAARRFERGRWEGRAQDTR